MKQAVATCQNKACEHFRRDYVYGDDYLDNVEPRCGNCGELLGVRVEDVAEAPFIPSDQAVVNWIEAKRASTKDAKYALKLIEVRDAIVAEDAAVDVAVDAEVKR